jgi:hypothetical protein
MFLELLWNSIALTQDRAYAGFLCSSIASSHIQEVDDRRRPMMKYSGTDIFLVCFSYSDEASLKKVHLYVKEMLHHSPGTPIYMVGFKSDLDTKIISQEQVDQIVKVRGGRFILYITYLFTYLFTYLLFGSASFSISSLRRRMLAKCRSPFPFAARRTRACKSCSRKRARKVRTFGRVLLFVVACLLAVS